MGLPTCILLPYFHVCAFATRVFEGNAAGVVVTAAPLSTALMTRIASENQLAETAFVVPVSDGYGLRWFTPTQEVPFCGHATLAAAHVLTTEYSARPPFRFHAAVGDLHVGEEGDRLALELQAHLPEECHDERVQALIGGGIRQTFRNFENIFVELEDEAAVRAFQPDAERIRRLHPDGLVITARGVSADFVSRYFAPSYGIPEDSVTGSTHATLVPYWAERLGRTSLIARQLSSRGATLQTRIAGGRVTLLGNAVTYARSTLYVPVDAS